MDNVKSGVYINAVGDDVDFNFYTSLSASNKINFVNSVVEIIVGDNYNSIIKDLIFDYMIIDVFTDVDVSYIKESTNTIDEIENLVDNTNIVEIVKMNVGNKIIDELKDAVDLGIEYRTGIHRNPIAESLSGLIDTFEQKIASVDLDSMMEIAQSISGISGELAPEKMLEAYANTDMYKNQWKKLEEDKLKNADADTQDNAENPVQFSVLSPLV